MAIDDRICSIEKRINALEVDGAKQSINIENLVKRMDSITAWLRALVITLIPCTLTGMGFLFMQVFRP